MATGMTKLEHLVNPQVMADMIAAELPKQIKLLPIVTVDDTLVGQPGDELTVPKWDYIGDADDMTEGQAMSITQMSKTDAKMKVKQAGKGVEITDTAVLSGYGDPIGEANRQLILSIASKMDEDVAKALAGASATHTVTGGQTAGMKVDDLIDAKDKFVDEDDSIMYLICNPANASQIRKDATKNWLTGTELGAEIVQSGVYGEVDGVRVIRTKRVEKDTLYLVKEGALRLLMKSGLVVESDRDIVKKTTVITADQHYGAYLYDKTKVIKITLGA